jgi:two-component system, cell cycle response regulator DivK
MTVAVLIADDDFDNRTIASEALVAAGYQTFMVANGMEALAFLEQKRPDVLLLDLSMPKINGWEVARRIRARRELDAMAIVAFTAHALVGDSEKALSAGCDDYLAKPCHPKEIVQVVVRALARKRPDAGAGAKESPEKQGHAA